MLVLVALSVMSVAWMSVIAVIVLAQKLLPAKAAIDVPLALAIVGLGVLIVIAPVVGSRAHAADVSRHRWRGPHQAVVTTTKERDNDRPQDRNT